MVRGQFTKDDLVRLLRTVDEDLDRRITLVLIGGTALTFLGIKDSTRDIDINIPRRADLKELARVFTALGFQGGDDVRWITDQGFPIDVFVGDYIFAISLPEGYVERSLRIGDFHNIDLYALNGIDLIITKLTRADERDYDDIRALFKWGSIDHRDLIERYIETVGDTSVVRYAKDNLLELFENKLPAWGVAVRKEDQEVIRGWKPERWRP